MNCNKLRGIRCENRKTHGECAAAINQKTATGYCHKENGRTPFTVAEAVNLAVFLNMSMQDYNEVFCDGKLTVS